MSSEPTTLRNVADVWLATALASSVLPGHTPHDDIQVLNHALRLRQPRIRAVLDSRLLNPARAYLAGFVFANPTGAGFVTALTIVVE